MMESILFDTSDSLVRVVVSVPILYLSVIAFIRISGKRTTSKMNGFDWIVTVAMGSLVSSGIILKGVHLAEVLLAIVMLIALQYVLTKVAGQSKMFATLVKSEPVLLLFDGRMLQDVMKQERVSEQEILAAVRGRGAGSMNAVMAVTLEADASLSILLRDAATDDNLSAFYAVRGWPCKHNTMR